LLVAAAYRRSACALLVQKLHVGPSDRARRAQRYPNKFDPPSWLWRACHVNRHVTVCCAWQCHLISHPSSRGISGRQNDFKDEQRNGNISTGLQMCRDPQGSSADTVHVFRAHSTLSALHNLRHKSFASSYRRMKQSTDHTPRRRPSASMNILSLVRVALIVLAWLAIIPFLLELWSVVLTTWR